MVLRGSLALFTEIFALTCVCCLMHSRGVNDLVKHQQLPVEVEYIVQHVWYCYHVVE